MAEREGGVEVWYGLVIGKHGSECDDKVIYCTADEKLADYVQCISRERRGQNEEKNI